MLAFVDCFSGISGDMLLGALVDAGVEPEALRAGLAALPLRDYHLEIEAATQRGLRGTRVQVVVEASAPQPERRLQDIEALIGASRIPKRARERALAIFRRLAAAEAAVHGIPVAEVHFHEVGATDAIVDIVGIALGLDLLDVDGLYCSELPLTTGRVQTAHGELPIPAPATLELLRGTGAVWRPVDTTGELVTPTGAAVVATLARFERPAVAVRATGYGFGQRELPWANCLRLFVGEAPSSPDADPAPFDTDQVTVIEAHIDNMTAEALGWLMERLLAAGALDVAYGPLSMKKNRPGTRLTALAEPRAADTLAGIIVRESATLGVRMSEMRRLKAGRRQERIATPLGEATVKLKLIGRVVTGVAAEYEDARAIAARHNLPFGSVVARIEASARAQLGLDASAPPAGSSVTDEQSRAQPGSLDRHP